MSCPFSNGSGQAPHPVPKANDESKPDGEINEEPIPQPPTHLFGLLGNFPDMDTEFPVGGIWRLADLYGPIFKIQLGDPLPTIVVSSQKLFNEASNQDLFPKIPGRNLVEVRSLIGDGLFTAFPTEENWHIAHRLLVPAFGPLGIKGMFDSMLDISSQMIMKWHRYGPDHVIDCADDFTRLAFDTIGFCAFGYRFNEFYTEEPHPFANQMAAALKTCGRRTMRSEFENKFHRAEERERAENIRQMHDLCRQVIRERREHPDPDIKDMLNAMLNGTDKETGKKLDEQGIINNCVTFLVAGHETTSGTLGFMWYHLLQNPDKLQKAQKEVDEIVGEKVLTVDMLPKLKYIDACVKETLRLCSPIGGSQVRAAEDTYLAGKYRVPKNSLVQFNVKGLHHDHTIWGDDHDDFKPERMLDGKFEALPPNSWKPFGNGMRACIGRTFAEQEIVINTALLLQRFQPEMADPSYELKLKATLTIKPDGFYIKVRPRPGRSMMTGIPGGVPSDVGKQHESDMAKDHHEHHADSKGEGKKVSIFFGGNTGTCESFAQQIGSKLDGMGFKADVKGLDAATERLSKDNLNIIITASYEGKPPDNAKKFVAWLESLDGEELKGIKYTLFGVGNSDWASTFHRVPKLVDEKLGKLGAERVSTTGFCNVKNDLVGPFDDWSDVLLDSLSTSDNKGPEEKSAVSVKVEKSKLSQDLTGDTMLVGTVVSNRELADTSTGPAKMHTDVRLPEGTQYKSGDYLVVQPPNPIEIAKRVMRFFGFAFDDMISIAGSKKKFLPTAPTAVGTFLITNVELATPITKKQLKSITAYAEGDHEQHLKKLLEDGAYAQLLEKRYSIIDVLEEHPIELPFEVYVDMLQPIVARQYSISSSPLAQKGSIASVTFDVHTSPAWSGHGVFEGAASTFLATRKVGDRISCFVRSTNVGFRLPSNPETPVIMFAAGTGIAPMRAFLQERADIAEAGARRLGPAMLFFGCRSGDSDFLYKDELAEWEKKGIVQVKPAFSRMGDEKKYVQDVIWENKEQIAELFAQNAKIYLCGSAVRLGRGCAEICKKIYSERTGADEKKAEEWLQSVKTDRYISDVY